MPPHAPACETAHTPDLMRAGLRERGPFPRRRQIYGEISRKPFPVTGYTRLVLFKTGKSRYSQRDLVPTDRILP